MKKAASILLLFFATVVFSQTKLLSWNIENLGKSKSDEEIAFIANVVTNFDVIAIQEVVAGYGGAQAVARLVDALNRKGNQWDYRISDPTSSSAYKTERYAFLWKTSKVRLKGKPWLEHNYHLEIDREPYFATFEIGTKEITLVNFHAITKNKQPEREIKYFKLLPLSYPLLNLLFLGDFNCPQSHSVFNPLKKMGYKPAFIGQKTSLKKSCKATNCLASEFDNIFYNHLKIKASQAGVVHFYDTFLSLTQARKISDHIPIWIEFTL